MMFAFETPIVLEPIKGINIVAAIEDALKIAIVSDCTVTFLFNDKEVVVPPDADVKTIFAQWRGKQNGQQRK